MHFMITLTALILFAFECSGKSDCRYENICHKTEMQELCNIQLQDPAKHCLDFEKTIKTDEDRNAILNKINNRRNKVAAGEIRSLPASADMIKLEWNMELEMLSQRWASQCVQYSSPDLKDYCNDLKTNFVGQNIATIYGDSPGLSPTALVDIWYMELLSINITIISRYRTSKASGFYHYDYFSQLVWSDSREVGCGSVKFRDSGNRTVYRLVCNFKPAGNREGRAVYTRGLPCSRCPDSATCDPHFTALCGKPIKQFRTSNKTNNSKDEKTTMAYEDETSVPETDKLATSKAIEMKDSVTEVDDDTFTPFDYFSHFHDFTRQLVTAAVTKHDCKDILSVDNFIDLLKKRMSSDSAFRELLFSTKSPTLTGFVDSSFGDPSVVAFVSKLYSKKESPTTTKNTESSILNSTLLADLVEAVIFRSASKLQFTDEAEHTTVQYVSDVSPVKIQAELARVQDNSDFTGHFFIPEDDDEESTGEATENYYDTSNLPIKDVMMEIEDIKKTTIDFLEEILEEDPVGETTATASHLSPDDMNIYKSGHSVMKKFLEDITDKTPQLPL